jgi:hypothetical protein
VPRAHLTPDILAGALFLLAGVAVFLLAGQYPVGDAARMGPGYFPRLLGGALALLGLAVIAVAWRRPVGTAAPGSLPAWLVVPVFWGLLAGVGRVGLTGLDLALAALLALCWPVSRPLFWVLASVGGFALLLEPLGLAIATLALMAGARQADPEMGWTALLALWFGLLALSVALFIWGLGTPIPLWPRFIAG